jgi:hypothetical protein
VTSIKRGNKNESSLDVGNVSSNITSPRPSLVMDEKGETYKIMD